MALIWRTDHKQLFFFRPDGKQRTQATGFVFRRRRDKLRNIWVHYRLIFSARPRNDLVKGKGSWWTSYESWETRGGVMARRHTLKKGIRLKIMRGGMRT